MQNDDSLMIALVLLGHPGLPDHISLAAALEPFSARITSGAPATENSATIFFLVGDCVCTILPIEAPVPIAQSDEPIKNAWYWPDAWNAIRQHSSHLIVSVSGADSGKERALLLQQLVHAIVDAVPSALAVLFPAADSLWPADIVKRTVSPTSKAVASPLFVSVRIARETSDEKDGYYASTKGLSAFDLMEIEVSGFKAKPEIVNEVVHNVAAYLIENGPVLQDGEKLELDQNRKATVHHQSSISQLGTEVYSFHLDI